MPASAADPDKMTSNHDSRRFFKDPVIYTQVVVVAADRAHVWRLFTDFSTYKDWNPFVLRVEGEAVVGGELRLKTRLSSNITVKLKHRVSVLDYEKKFCWDNAGLPALFASAHQCLTLESMSEDKVLVKQEVIMDGGLINTADALMGRRLTNGVAAETAALKRYAEMTFAGNVD
ncbi:MAG: SRPBCC domain-containing protein [Longispora sp.]|nr:SRPBCC domain-containing protein [Longispora sp. (in: high G+C Gram-positive bacteria)]